MHALVVDRRRGGLVEPAARGRGRCLSGAYAASARSPSGRFLPPDPRVREPVPADAAARAPRGDPRRRRARRLRRPLLPPVVAAGALGRQVPRRPRTTSSAHPRRGAARADPRPRRRGRRLERRGDRRSSSGSATCRRRGATSSSSDSRVLDVPPRALAREVDERSRPAHADHGQDRGRRAAGQLPLRAPGRVPRSRDRPGVPARLPLRALAAQILGYTGEISPEELKALRRDGYRAGDRIGKTGIEAAYDSYLRGRPGSRRFASTRSGGPSRGSSCARRRGPGTRSGSPSTCALQRAAEQALRYGIDLAHQNDHWAADGGAIVALDPRDGAVLAMASLPTYKPSVFVGRTDPEKLAPLSTRPRAGELPGASTGRPPASTRPARRGSRSRRSRACRSTSSPPTTRSSAARRRSTASTGRASATGTPT